MPLKLKQAVIERIRIRKEANAKWHEFVAWVAAHPAPRWAFRGQSSHWPLKPAIGRQNYKPEQEILLVAEFKRQARGFGGIESILSSSNDWDWLALAQHHGLPTRLLDWSLNPLVSAHFACRPSPRDKKAGVLYAIEPREVGFLDELAEELPEEAKENPFAIDRVCFFRPPIMADRIKTQKGIFSAHNLPDKNFSTHRIERFEIPAELKHDFQKLIFGFGVDAGFLMADLDGLCASLKWQSENGAIR